MSSSSSNKKGKGKGQSNVNQYETLSSITELNETGASTGSESAAADSVSASLPEKTVNENTLNTREGCLKYLLSMLDKCSYTLSLKECVVVNRSVKFLLKQESVISFSDDTALTEKVAVETVCQGVALGHSNKAFTLDESSIIYYCIEFVSKK